MANRIEVDVDEYVFEHGKNPRGEGTWIFDLCSVDGMLKRVYASGRYGDARRRAMSDAREFGGAVVRVIVCP